MLWTREERREHEYIADNQPKNLDPNPGRDCKSGECCLQVVELEECPADILVDVNRYSPCTCMRSYNIQFNY